MLSTPRAGWTTITLGEWSDRASYLTDVAMDLLDGFINHTNTSFTVEFDAEGWEFEVTFNEDFTNIITNYDVDDIRVHKSFYINKSELALELAEDIENDLDGWAIWFGIYNEEDAIHCFYRKIKLADKIAKIRELYGETK